MEARALAQEQKLIELSSDFLYQKERTDILEKDVKEYVEFSRALKLLLRIFKNIQITAIWLTSLAAASVVIWAIIKFVVFQSTPIIPFK